MNTPEADFGFFIDVFVAMDIEFSDFSEEEDGNDQNVHDHGIASGVRASAAEIRVLLGEREPKEMSEVTAELETLTDYLLSDASEGLPAQTISRCMEFTDSLADTEYDAFGGLSERRALACVWRHLREFAPPEMLSNLRETLFKEMAEGLDEGGAPVCSTGKLSRIFAVYDGTDLLVARPRPMWAVRQELASMAAAHREHGKGRMAFEEKAKAEYIERMGMSEALVWPIIQEYSVWVEE